MRTLLSLTLVCSFAAAADHPGIRDDIDSRAQRFGDISRRIWELAEVGYQETQSSALLAVSCNRPGFGWIAAWRKCPRPSLPPSAKASR